MAADEPRILFHFIKSGNTASYGWFVCPLPRQNLGEAHIAIADFIGRLGRTRTCNPQIRSLVLYPLSYEASDALVRLGPSGPLGEPAGTRTQDLLIKS